MQFYCLMEQLFSSKSNLRDAEVILPHPGRTLILVRSPGTLSLLSKCLHLSQVLSKRISQKLGWLWGLWETKGRVIDMVTIAKPSLVRNQSPETDWIPKRSSQRVITLLITQAMPGDRHAQLLSPGFIGPWVLLSCKVDRQTQSEGLHGLTVGDMGTGPGYVFQGYNICRLQRLILRSHTLKSRGPNYSGDPSLGPRSRCCCRPCL